MGVDHKFASRAEAHVALGRAYIKLGKKEEAMKAFRAVGKNSKLARVAELYGIYAANGSQG